MYYSLLFSMGVERYLQVFSGFGFCSTGFYSRAFVLEMWGQRVASEPLVRKDERWIQAVLFHFLDLWWAVGHGRFSFRGGLKERA